MKIASQHANALGCISGSWRIWSLSDGYAEMPANLLKEPDGRVHRRQNVEIRGQRVRL
jgi:hypothetical protein